MQLRQLSCHFLLAVLPFAITVSSQGTVTLNLATSNEETSTTVSVPFNSLFDASSTQQGVSIQVSSGNNVPISQDEISCQCFSDSAGSQPLGETFNNVFPGTELGEEPVKIGSILCSESKGLKAHSASSGNGATAGNQQPPPPPVTTTQPPPPTTTPTSTAATSPTATSTAALNNNIQPPPPPPSSSSPSSPLGNNNNPTAFLKFALSTDPSDDSSTQMPVPIDNSIVEIDGSKQAASVTVVTVSGMQQSDSSSSA
ncbi:MAG: hypothetical protein Q9225_004955, partial [Loekoesia sp. 1 TL-2023]